MANPFNITFGELPRSLITREDDIQNIEKIFKDETPESKVYIITGTRGSGKTVLLTGIKNDLKNDDYICIDLNPYEELYEQFASKLYDEGKLKRLFLHPEFSFSFKGVTLSIEGTNQLNNVSILIEKMLNFIQSKGKRVLITIDDVSSTSYLKSFIYFYQQLLREGYPIFLLMSGLYENVSELQNNKSLTFFLRAPKLNLRPLNLITIAYSYMNLLNLDKKEAAKYAKMTCGYAYAYQLLGSMLYKNELDRKNLILLYEQKLNENAYYFIWEKLTEKEKSILLLLNTNITSKQLCDTLALTNGYYQVYKKRLISKGILVSNEYGHTYFALPKFSEFLSLQKYFDEDDDDF